MAINSLNRLGACVIALGMCMGVSAQETNQQERYDKVTFEEFNKFIKGLPENVDEMPGLYFLIVAAEDGKIMTHNGYFDPMYDAETDFLKCYPLSSTDIELKYESDGNELYLDASNQEETALKFLFHKYSDGYKITSYCVNIKHPDGRCFTIKKQSSSGDYERDFVFTSSADLDKCKFELTHKDPDLFGIGMYENSDDYDMAYFLTYDNLLPSSKDKSFMAEKTDDGEAMFYLYMLDHFSLGYVKTEQGEVRLSTNIRLPENTSKYDLALKYIINNGEDVTEDDLMASDNAITIESPDVQEIRIPHTSSETNVWVLPVVTGTVAARASDPAASPLGRISKFIIPDEESGIIAISSDEAGASVVYYNLQGQIIPEPVCPGIYVKRHGNHAEKVVIR